MVHSTQTVHLSCAEINTVSKRNKMSFHLTHVTKEFHRVRPKTTSEPIACSAQTMHLSCVEINTISKRTETRFHFTHVTSEYHQVYPNLFMSLWCILRKPCTYLMSWLTLSPNRLKRASTSSTSPRSTIRFIPTDFWAYCTFGTKHESILLRH